MEQVGLRKADVDRACYPSAGVEVEGYTSYYADRYTVDYDKQDNIKTAVCGIRKPQHWETLFGKSSPEAVAHDRKLGDSKIEECARTEQVYILFELQ